MRVSSFSKGFFDNFEPPDLLTCMFFPFINGDWPYISSQDGGKDSFLESVFELLNGSYFATRYIGFLKKVLEFGNVVIDEVPFHFQFCEIHSGLFNLASMSVGSCKHLDEVFPERIIILGDRCEELQGAVLSGQKSAGRVSTEAESKDQIEGQEDYVECRGTARSQSNVV